MEKMVLYDRDYSNNIYKRDFRKEIIYEVAKRENCLIEKEYLDYDINQKTKKMEELINDIKNGKVKNVVSFRMETLSRDIVTVMQIIEGLRQNAGNLFIVEKEKKIGLSKQSEIGEDIIAFTNDWYAGHIHREILKCKGMRYKSGSKQVFEKELKDKPISLGIVLIYSNGGNIITNKKEMLGNNFDEFSINQLCAKVIPKSIDRKNNITIEFANESDRYLFRDSIFNENKREEDELEM